MPLICNKHTKKLFLALATLSAIAADADLSFNNVKVFGLRDVLLYVARQRAAKFNNLTTVETHPVMMLDGWLHLVMVVRLVKMKFLY